MSLVGKERSLALMRRSPSIRVRGAVLDTVRSASGYAIRPGVPAKIRSMSIQKHKKVILRRSEQENLSVL